MFTRRLGLSLFVLLMACGDDSAAFDAGGAGDVAVAPDAGSDSAVDASAVCIPTTCETAGRCGMVADGCGGTLDCLENCPCTDTDFETACPSMPCEVPMGCDAGQCVYEAVQCGGESCTCAGGECEESTLRSCGDALCTPEFCDPGATEVDGVMHFANSCVADGATSCGVCELGAQLCDADTGGFVCNELIFGLGNAERAECNSESFSSSFVFLDPAFAGGGSDGSRPRPFTTLNDAVFAAQARNAEGVVIGGSPTFTEPLTLTDGVSIHGGFGGAPDFRADSAERPRWFIAQTFQNQPDASSVTRVMGMAAENIVRRTVIQHIAIETEDITVPLSTGAGVFGSDNYGVHVLDSPGLVLVDLDVRAGDGGPSNAGQEGQVAPFNASLMNGAVGAYGPDALSCFAGGLGVRGGLGGAGTTCIEGPTRAGGVGGGGQRTSSGVSGGGADGEGTAGNGGSRARRPLPSTAARDAEAGRPGPGGATGATGTPGSSAGSVVGGFWVADYNATAGATGVSGAGGGGGGGGARGVFTFPGPPPQTFCPHGSSGSGGGAGGCGGGGGGAASPAGNSFAIMLVNSSGCEIQGGTFRAGDGGAGSSGGAGRSGAGGGSGAAAVGPGPFALIYTLGRGGGDGGRGGDGGDGGNSAGGSSFGVLCEETTLMSDANFEAGNGGPGGERAGTDPAPAGDSHVQIGCEL